MKKRQKAAQVVLKTNQNLIAVPEITVLEGEGPGLGSGQLGKFANQTFRPPTLSLPTLSPPSPPFWV